MGVQGGDKFEKYMEEMKRKLSNGASQVRVGFLSRARYPNGTPVAMIAAIHNWGAPRAGIPPRPFFSNMIADKSPEWPGAMGALLVANGYDASLTLRQTGENVARQLRQSIQDTNEPPLAEATIQRKGFDKPLVESGHMFNSVDFETKE